MSLCNFDNLLMILDSMFFIVNFSLDLSFLVVNLSLSNFDVDL